MKTPIFTDKANSKWTAMNHCRGMLMLCSMVLICTSCATNSRRGPSVAFDVDRKRADLYVLTTTDCEIVTNGVVSLSFALWNASEDDVLVLTGPTKPMQVTAVRKACLTTNSGAWFSSCMSSSGGETFRLLHGTRTGIKTEMNVMPLTCEAKLPEWCDAATLRSCTTQIVFSVELHIGCYAGNKIEWHTLCRDVRVTGLEP